MLKDINGIIIIDKPKGWTSHDVVAKLRGALKIKRVGHGGTLDPMATGVLPIFVGRATRAAEFSESADKEYIAGLMLGIVTDTQDTTGKTLRETDVDTTDAEVEAVLPRFLGASKQTPPMYSAIKQGGKKLYELARKGIEVHRPERDIFIADIEMLESKKSSKGTAHLLEVSKGTAYPHPSSSRTIHLLSDEYILRIACSKGTYIRTLCHDIGRALGCGAAMSSLRRTRAGAFTIDMAHTLESALDAVSQGELAKIIKPVDSMFPDYPAITLGEADSRRCKNGLPCRDGVLADGRYRFYGPDNEFLLLGEVVGREMRIIKSFFTP